MDTPHSQSAEALRVVAVLPDPIGPKSSPFLNADPRWLSLKEAASIEGGSFVVRRHRPPSSTSLAEMIFRVEPDVVYLDTQIDESGLTLEGEFGEEVRKPWESVGFGRGRKVVLVTRNAAPEAIQRAVDAGFAAALAINSASDTRDLGFEENTRRLARLLRALGEGTAVGKAGREPKPLVRGDLELAFVGRDGASRPRFIDRVPRGTPEAEEEGLIADSKLVDLARSLASVSTRGALVVGSKGAGKSETLRWMARRCCHRFPDGILWIERPVPVEAFLERAAFLLGEAPAEDSLVHELRRHRVLIILDDFGNLEEKLQAPLAKLLARISPWSDTKLLVAAREAPAALRSLELAVTDLDTGLQKEALRRALAILRESGLDLQDRQIEKVATYFRGNPAAMNLALKRPQAFEQLVANDSLASMDGIVPRTISDWFGRGVGRRLEWQIGHQLKTLSPDARLLLACVSVFRAAPTFRGVEEIWLAGCRHLDRQSTEPGEKRGLSELIEELRSAALAEPRHQILSFNPQAAALAADALTDQARNDVENAFVQWHLNLVRFYGSDVEGMESQMPNLEKAVELAFDLAERGEAEQSLVIELARQLSMFQRERGRFREAADALQVARSQVDGTVWVGFTLEMGDLYLQAADPARAAGFYREASACAEESSAQHLAALQKGGMAEARAGRFAEARALLEQSLESTQDDHAKGISLLNLGLIELHDGSPPRALAHFDKSLQNFRRTKDRRGEAFALDGLGRAELIQGGSPDKAEALLVQSAERWRELQQPQMELATMELLGRLVESRKPEAARGYRVRARELHSLRERHEVR